MPGRASHSSLCAPMYQAVIAILYYSIDMPRRKPAQRPANASIRVAVVDNDPLRLVGFRALLEGDAEFVLRGYTPTTIFSAQGYDVVLIGSRTGPTMYEVMSALKSLHPKVCIIVTGNGNNEELALRALAAGAKGFLDESADIDDYKQAIRAIHGGEVWAPPRVLSQFIERMTQVPQRNIADQPLIFTEREREVLNLLVSGRSNREIGIALGIEERTVKMHIASLMRKTGVTNRIALSIYALTHSLLGVGHADS